MIGRRPGYFAARALTVSAAIAAGCGDPLADGDYFGEATLRLRGTIGTTVGDPERARVGAMWLSYSAAFDGGRGSREMTMLPVSSLRFPPTFVFDVLEAPPSVGSYSTHDGRILTMAIRFAQLLLFDDQDGDGRFALDDAGQVAAPDRLLASAGRHLLLFVREPPDDPASLAGAGNLLTNWESAIPGYHVVELDPAVARPDFSGRVVPSETPIVFLPPAPPAEIP